MSSIKKLLVFGIVFALLISLLSCSLNTMTEKPQNGQTRTPGDIADNNQNTDPNDVPQLAVLRDYLPDKEMTKVFTGGFENSGMVHIIEKVTDQKVQIRQSDTGGTIIKVYEATEEAIFLVYAKMLYDHLEGDFTVEAHNRDEVVLKSPLTVGTSWEEYGMTHTITRLNARVSTPAGVFQAIEITATDGAYYTCISYYARGLGLIKLTSPDSKVELIKVYDNIEGLDETFLQKYLGN
jgi:hypothetical protein